jgi:hypothetical protein
MLYRNSVASVVFSHYAVLGMEKAERMTVSGLTINMAERQSGQSRESLTQRT